MTSITETIESGIDRVHETERVLRWRAQELRRAGYQPADALILALRTDVDLHVAADLLARGCSEPTALLILI
jgi:hypothetical protein